MFLKEDIISIVNRKLYGRKGQLVNIWAGDFTVLIVSCEEDSDDARFPVHIDQLTHIQPEADGKPVIEADHSFKPEIKNIINRQPVRKQKKAAKTTSLF
jgi:hypothetical protein